MLISGLSRKKLITALAIAFLILLAGGCLKYCAKASRSLETSSPETVKADKKQASLKPVKAPTPLSDNLLEDFPEDVKKYFQYVVLIDKSAWESFLNNDKPLDTSKSTALSGQKTPLPAKHLAISDIKENQIIVTSDLVGHIFDNLGKNWYLDWDRLRNTFRPLTIRLGEGLPQSNLKSIFAEVLEKSGPQSLTDVQATKSINPGKLSQDVEEFLKGIPEVEKENIKLSSTNTARMATTDSDKPSKSWLGKLKEKVSEKAKKSKSSEGTKENGGQSSTDADPKQFPDSDKMITARIDPALKQRLAFFSHAHGPIDGCYVIFYLKDNNYGLRPRKKLGCSDGKAIVMQQVDLIGALSPLFKLDAPTLVLKDKELTKVVDKAMAHRKGTNGKLNDTERNKLKELLTANVMESLKK